MNVFSKHFEISLFSDCLKEQNYLTGPPFALTCHFVPQSLRLSLSLSVRLSYRALLRLDMCRNSTFVTRRLCPESRKAFGVWKVLHGWHWWQKVVLRETEAFRLQSLCCQSYNEHMCIMKNTFTCKFQQTCYFFLKINLQITLLMVSSY